MIMTQHEEQISLPITPPNVLSGSREAMEPLYEQLLQQAFPDSHSAVQFCRHACAEFGFTVKQEASANRNIYVYCSREGLPDSQRKPKSAPQRKRPSKRCDCRWRVVLTENSQGLWEFRKASSPTAYEHNHEMMDPKEMVKSWPSEVNTFIIQLARQRMQTHEIRDFVKQRFPNITWNERRFYNRLTEERKRIKQRDVMERTQRLLFLSAKVCSLVAANDEWSMNVEHELTRLCDTYAQLNRLNPDAIPLTDFNVDQITVDLDQFLQSSTNIQQPPPAYLFEEHRSSFSSDEESSSSMIKMEIDDHTIQSTNAIPQLTANTNTNTNSNATNATATMAAVSSSSQSKNSNKKRKSILLDDISTCSSPPSSSQQQTSSPPPTTWSSTITPPKGTHVVYVPAYALFVRSHNTRSSSDTSSTSSSSHLTHRKSFQHDITSPSSLMDISSPHPQQTMSFHPPHPHSHSHHHHQHHHDNPSFFSLASPTSPSSSSVASSHFQHRPPSSSSTTSTMNHPTSPSSMIHTSTTNVTTPSHFQPSPPSDHPPHSFYMKSTYPQQQQQQQPTSSSLNQPHSFNGMPLQQAAQIYSMQSFSNYSPSSTNTNLPNNNNSSNNNNNNNNNSNNNATDMNFAFDQASLSSTDPTSPPPPHSATSNQRHPNDMYRTMMEFNPNHHPSSQQQDPRYMYSNNNGNNSGDGTTTTTSEPMNSSSHYRPSSNSSTHSASQRLQTDHPDMMNRLMMDQASMS